MCTPDGSKWLVAVDDLVEENKLLLDSSGNRKKTNSIVQIKYGTNSLMDEKISKANYSNYN